MQPAPFPVGRPRRLRSSRVLRELVREHELSRRDLVAPLFVKEGIAEAAPIASMPGHAQHTLESLRKEAAELAGLGIPALLLFGIPADKDAEKTSQFGASTQMKRPAQPEEIAPAYVFLAAPSCASYITGIVLPVTGSVGS